MITPRRTRLVRVPDLHDFRRVIKTWCIQTVRPSPSRPQGASAFGAGGRSESAKDFDTTKACEDRAVIVPTRGAAMELSHTLPAGNAHPLLSTRDQLYDVLSARLDTVPRRLTMFDRDAIAQAAAEEAAREVEELPFQIRPGLVAEMLRFYDHLRRQSQHVTRFETLITDALGGAAHVDRGAERLLTQTRFLAGSFRAYERRVSESGACDEHGLRHRLIDESSARGVRHILVTVPDWIADPAGLFAVDFDLLSRLPGLETLDLVCTESVLRSGFHERIHQWWPGLEEPDLGEVVEPAPRVRPILVYPASADSDRPWFTYRDREEELTAIARRLGGGEGDDTAWNRRAVVFKRPLPYLYLAPDTLGASGVAYQVVDALPLAAEPMIATVDLILDAVETRFARAALAAILGSPHLRFTAEGGATFRQSIGEMNRELSDSRYLGGLDRLEAFVASPKAAKAVGASHALQAGVAVARELAVLIEARPASQQIGELLGFLERHLRLLEAHDPFADVERRARATLTRILGDLATARTMHHDALWTIDELAAALRRWIGEETFPNAGANGGVHLVDDQAARYGEFDDMTIVGLIENEWPDRPRRNIFYPPGLLKALGWPSEKDRRAASDARFLDLLASASRQVALSTFTLDDEALVTRSIQLDEVPRAGLSAVSRDMAQSAGLHPSTLLGTTLSVSSFDLAQDDRELVERSKGGQACPDGGPPLAEIGGGDWAPMRRSRSSADAPMFHGAAGPRPAQSWSVSALETYTTCPFKFFAQHVLKLEEEPDDEEVMDPRRQGQLVHKVFESFFADWQSAGHRAITSANLDAARALFVAVVDRSLEQLPEGEAALERTRLLGSSAAAGLGDAVFRMEAERSIPVVERLLEHELRGHFTMTTASGPRDVELRGKADRVDLLADGTFRLIDYKLGWPPDRNRALQLPIYSICAEQRLTGRHGRSWTLGEAVYLAFKGPKRVVPLFTSPVARDEVLAKAQQRLADTIDAIHRGEFPPAPDDVYRCETCSFASVCRKDYVGNV